MKMHPLNLITLTPDSGDRGADSVFRMSLTEAVAYAAGEPSSNYPACLCTVLRVFGVGLSRALPDDKRQQLKPLILPMVGTAGDGHAESRGYLALDWLIRTYLPTWLQATQRIDPAFAQSIRDFEPIVDRPTARGAGQLMGPAVREAAAAWRDAARAATPRAQGIASSAAMNAARLAGEGAAAGAAGHALQHFSEIAMKIETVCAATGYAAQIAAACAAQTVADDDGADAANRALQPTVSLLQDSAIAEFGRMVRLGRVDGWPVRR